MLAGKTFFSYIPPVEQFTKEKDLYAILFRVVVKPNMRQEFIDFMKWDCDVVKELEPKTLRFDVLEDPGDKNVFYIYEAYKDMEAFEEHKKNEPFQHWSSGFRDEVVEDFKLMFTGKPLCSPFE